MGNLLAILSVFAVLSFGAWTAIGTFTGTGGLPTALKPQVLPTVVPTKPAANAATSAPSAAVASAPSAVPSGTPARVSTPAPGGSRVHVVGQGDTLYRIASLYGTTVEAIMAANGFTDRSKVLHIGDKLSIP
jgi:LysM repeat protein